MCKYKFKIKLKNKIINDIDKYIYHHINTMMPYSIPNIEAIYDYTNTKLYYPYHFICNMMNVNKKSLPSFLQSPLSVCLATIIGFILLVLFSSNTLCEIISIGYPLFYNWRMTNNLIPTLYKYWILISVLSLVELLFSPIFQYIPNYYFFKIIFVYILFRNDFKYNHQCYDVLAHKIAPYFVKTIEKKYDLLLNFVFSNCVNIVLAVKNKIIRSVIIDKNNTVNKYEDETMAKSEDHTVTKSVDEPMIKFVDETINTSIDKTINTSVDKTINTSVDKTINTSVDETINTSVDETIMSDNESNN